MKTLFIAILSLTSLTVQADILTGYWKAAHAKELINFQEDGKYFGSLLPQSGTPSAGLYEWLSDGSGILVSGREGYTVIINLREKTENRLIFDYYLGVAIILTKATKEEIEKFTTTKDEKKTDKGITYNLRQIVAAGQQYILENGVKEVSFKDLNGIYFPKLKPVNGETYDDLKVIGNKGELTVVDKDGVKYSYPY